MEKQRGRWQGPAAAGAVLVVLLMARGGHGSAPPAPSPSAPAPSASHPSTTASAAPSAAPQASDYEPARFAAPVRKYADRAGINPELLMAILYNESYKPHGPEVERAWQRLKPDAAFGIANMHRAAYEECRQGRDFAGRSWEELPDDPDLAVEAAAWHLHDLAAQLPGHWAGPYSKDELLALGYNTGAGNMLAFARGATPGAAARSYLDKLHDNRAKAESALR